MKKNILYIIIILLGTSSIYAQNKEYNIKGDEAYSRSDFRDAKIWYEEGVANCDNYSIKQLTNIWLEIEDMRPSMRSVMAKCFNCITLGANEQDLKAIELLSLFYKEGIGTPRDEKLAEFWRKQYSKLSNTNNDIRDSKISKIYNVKPQFFMGYIFSPSASYGLNIGVLWKENGAYCRLKSNLRFQKSSFNVNNTKVLSQFPELTNDKYLVYSNKYKESCHTFSVGYIRKINEHFFLSSGIGYGARYMLMDFGIFDKKTDNLIKSEWAEYSDLTYKGIEVEADLMYRYKKFYASAGINTIQFKFIDYSIGIGIFF